MFGCLKADLEATLGCSYTALFPMPSHGAGSCRSAIPERHAGNAKQTIRSATVTAKMLVLGGCTMTVLYSSLE
jgi:hypothetical protein